MSNEPKFEFRASIVDCRLRGDGGIGFVDIQVHTTAAAELATWLRCETRYSARARNPAELLAMRHSLLALVAKIDALGWNEVKP